MSEGPDTSQLTDLATPLLAALRRRPKSTLALLFWTLTKGDPGCG